MRHPHKFINLDFVRKHLAYDPVTGQLRMLVNTPRLPVGHVFTTKYPGTYIRVTFLGVSFMAHRVAWVLMTGEQPDVIDHDNGIKHDNRWTNLKSGTHADNSMNQVRHREARGVFQTTEPC